MSGDFQAALDAIDNANRLDPSIEKDGENEVPAALLYSQRMTATLLALHPNSDESLRLAARGQHLRRWEVPRKSYPATREGYLAWRSGLYRFHAEKMGEIMRRTGCADDDIARVQKIIGKTGIKSDPDVQLIEDVACLVFLEHYAASFASEHEPEKMLSILRKTWRKMSSEGQEAALALSLPPAVAELVAATLAPNR